mgnify:CR=1 FL=1|tara:strand:- start:284 stop:406 length:123 start_codon:yes stop_codon:yes gene_type:complete
MSEKETDHKLDTELEPGEIAQTGTLRDKIFFVESFVQHQV